MACKTAGHGPTPPVDRRPSEPVHLLFLGLSLLAAVGCEGSRREIEATGGRAVGAGTGGGAAGSSGSAGEGGGNGTAGAGPGTAGAGGGPAGAGGAAGAGCIWTPGPAAQSAGPSPTQNNSADLRGAVLGELPFSAATARRAVPVKVGTTIAGVEVGAAYLLQTSSASPSVDVVIPVKNGGTDYPCFVLAESFHYLSAAGALLNAASYQAYLNGSVGDVGKDKSLVTHSCLAPGESGYFIDNQVSTTTHFFTATGSIEMNVTSKFSGKAPPGRLTPTQYEIGTCAGYRSIRVTGLNDSTANVGVGSSALGPGILLDADGLPAAWIFLQADVPAGNIGNPPVQVPAGGTIAFLSDLVKLPAVTRAQFFLDFEGAP